MSNIQFTDENSNIAQRKAVANTGFARKLIQWGVVKNESQANLVLVAIIFIGISITVFNTISLLKTPTPPPIEEVTQN